MRKTLHRSLASIHICTCSHMHTPTQTHTTHTQSFSWVCTWRIIWVMRDDYYTNTSRPVISYLLKSKQKPIWLWPKFARVYKLPLNSSIPLHCTLPIWLHRLATHGSQTGFASWTNITNEFQPVIWDRVLRNTVRAKPLLDTRKSSFWLNLCCSNLQVPTGLHTQSPMCGCEKTARHV